MTHAPSGLTLIPSRNRGSSAFGSVLAFAFLLVLLTVIPLSSHAEWTSEGVIFNNGDFVNYFEAVPCPAGGMWFVWAENYDWDTTEIYAQRITEEGDLVFPEPLTPHDEALDGDIIAGALPGEDGSLLLVYARIDTDGVTRLFVQRFALDGTRLHDGFGQYASDPDNQSTIYFWGIGARTDDNGGCWTLFDQHGALYLNGWNTDGTQKLDENLEISVNTSDNDSRLIPDGAGGVIHMEVRPPEDPYPDQPDIYMQRYNYDGSTQFPEPLLVNEDGGDLIDDRDYLVMDAQNDGVFLLTENHWQYYDSAFNPLWPEVVDPYVGSLDGSVLSPPVVFQDNTVVQALSGHSTGNGMMLIHADGTIDNSTVYPIPLFQISAVRDLKLNSDNHLVTQICLDVDSEHEQYYIVIFDSLGNEVHDRVQIFPEPRDWISPHFDWIKRFDDVSFLTMHLYNEYWRLWRFDELTGAIYGRPDAVSESGSQSLPQSFSITSVYPNPFNSACTIQIDVSRPTALSFAVYDILGALVHEESIGETAAGMHTIHWAPVPDHASGLYFVRLQDGAAGLTQTRKIVLIK